MARRHSPAATTLGRVDHQEVERVVDPTAPRCCNVADGTALDRSNCVKDARSAAAEVNGTNPVKSVAGFIADVPTVLAIVWILSARFDSNASWVVRTGT